MRPTISTRSLFRVSLRSVLWAVLTDYFSSCTVEVNDFYPKVDLALIISTFNLRFLSDLDDTSMSHSAVVIVVCQHISVLIWFPDLPDSLHTILHKPITPELRNKNALKQPTHRPTFVSISPNNDSFTVSPFKCLPAECSLWTHAADDADKIPLSLLFLVNIRRLTFAETN